MSVDITPCAGEPERIWADATWVGEDGGQKEGSWVNHTKNGIPYVRADIYEALQARISELELAMEKAAAIAEDVNEWCEPIGQYKHMIWYQDAGKEIAFAIRENLDETYKIVVAANE